MRCARCNQENRPEARFCRSCGNALARPWPCPACGAEAAPDAAFCDRCGVRLDGAADQAPIAYTPRRLADRILTERDALEGERRHLTVLFADVAGFTSLAERLDPEEARAILERCFERILEQVHRYDGTVNQFTGDGVMALFGAPVALEDAPRRAVLAALGIQHALAALRQELLATRRIDFRVRVGINSGLVVVGKIGSNLRMEYTVIGDTINLGARLQGLAEPGTVLYPPTIRRALALLAELARREGRRDDAERLEADARRPAERLAAALSAGELRRALEAAGT